MVRCSKALEFGVCTHLELLNASVHLSLNKDGSDGMNSQNKDIFDSFLRLIFLWQSWCYPRAKGLQIFQRFAKFRILAPWFVSQWTSTVVLGSNVSSHYSFQWLLLSCFWQVKHYGLFSLFFHCKVTSVEAYLSGILLSWTLQCFNIS